MENEINNNVLGVVTDNYYTTFEYSERFAHLFNSVIAEGSLYTMRGGTNLTEDEAKAISMKYSILENDLDIGEIKLDTQEKADKIIAELRADIKLLHIDYTRENAK